MPFQLLQITAQYSNAVLVAVMPYVSDFAKKLDLPIQQPVTMRQVSEFKCSSRSDLIGGRVTLTNGYEFVFLHGRVEMYKNPQSYYTLQDPDLIPKLYGPVKFTEPQALQIAHATIKKLGYTDKLLAADRPPQVTPPPQDGTHFVPRYRIRWYDPTRGHDPNNPPPSVEFEVDASTGQIQMMSLKNPNSWRPDPNIAVHPPVVGEAPHIAYQNGRKLIPVSQAYSNAFLEAILPVCSAYAKTIGFPLKHPIALGDVDRSTYTCALVDNDPMATFSLKNGAQFDYRHGQVIAFYAPDVMELPGREISHSPAEFEKFQAKFYGKANMSKAEAVALVRQTVIKLGYSESVLHMDEPPNVAEPGWWGTNRIVRCFISWKESSQGPFRVSSEVDIANKQVKSLYINDHANTNIWRTPPKIAVSPN